MTPLRAQVTQRLTNSILHSSAIIVFLFVISGALQAQNITGRWEWEEVAVRNKPQTRFSLIITRKANIVRGSYSVDEFINGEWQGEDGNQTPFLGLVNGKDITLKFDPLATVPGYQQNVKYQTPTDGRKPSFARLTLSGNILRWRIISGAGIEGLPNGLSLKRALRR